MTYEITEACKEFFQLIFDKLDQIKERQKDLLDCLHNEQMIVGTVWESVLISQNKLKREWRKRKRQRKKDGKDSRPRSEKDSEKL